MLPVHSPSWRAINMNLSRAFAHLENLGIAVVASDEVLIHEPVATVNLSGITGVVHRGLASHEFRDRGLLEGQSGQHLGGGIVVCRERGDRTCLHAGDLEGNGLVGADRPSKALTAQSTGGGQRRQRGVG